MTKLKIINLLNPQSLEALIDKSQVQINWLVQIHSPSEWFLMLYEWLNKAVGRGSNLQNRLSGIRCSLDDMADDAVGLLDALGIKRAHICGASMGAMITQIIGYRHPSRVLSLIPIMGSTGNPDLPQAKPEAMQFLLTPAPTEREAFIEHGVKMWKVLYASFPYDEADSRKRVAASYDRSFYPQGMARQLMAIIAHGNRKPHLSSVSAPTLVIHGAEDPLVPVEGGRDMAEATPGANLLIIDKRGHALPKEAWPQIVEAIVEHTRKTQV